MKKRIFVATAALLIVGAFTVPSFAQVIGTVSGKSVNVIRLSRADLGNKGQPLPTITPTTTADAQAAISSDKALRAFLEEHNVEINNVIAIETAADGSKLVYLK